MNAQYIEAINWSIEPKYPTLFLGGGITGCHDWQAQVVAGLRLLPITIYNPRRQSFDITKQEESEKQINWEYNFLRKCQQVLFYFPPETMCPITLFELGATLERSYYQSKYQALSQKIFVCCHPEYKRIFDVRYQVKKTGYGHPIVWTDLNQVIKEIALLNS